MKTGVYNFYIPDFYRFYNLNLKLILMLKEYPERFYEGVNIKSVYGAFPGAIWNGGRYLGGDKVDFITASQIIQSFNDLNVSIRYTWTNGAIPPETKDDFYCNMLTSLADDWHNEILVNQPWLEKHLRKNYKNFSYISSITKRLNSFEDVLNEFNKDYILVVPPRNYIFDPKFLEKLPRNKTELLLNSFCVVDCPNFFDHHYQTSLFIAGLAADMPPCISKRLNLYEQINNHQSISVEELYSFYTSLGFFNFKIEGRSYHPIEMIELYVYYMIKPEYRLLVRQELLSLVIGDKIGWA